MLFGEGKPFWGIDIGSRSLKGVRLAHTRRGVQLLDAAIYEFPDEKISLSEGISVLLGESLSKVRAAIHFSGRVSPVIRPLSLPVMPKKELEEVVRWEARKLTPLPQEETVVDFLIMGEREEQQVRKYEIVVIVVEKAALVEQLQHLKDSGLTVTAVDVAPMALLNTARLHYSGDLPGNLLYVDIGAQRMEINILKGGVIRFTRQVLMGGDTITSTLVQALGLAFNEAEQRKRQEGITSGGSSRSPILEQIDRFIVEIQRSVDYYRAQSRETGVDRILLMGGMTLLPGFLEYFSSFFDAPVEIEDPFSKMDYSDPGVAVLKDMAPRFSLAVGLALRKR